MPKITKPLSETQVRQAKPQEKAYKLMDGDGLYLIVNPSGQKLWRFDYTRPDTHKRNTLSFGRYPDVGLAQARELRQQHRAQVASGVDPSAFKQAQRIEQAQRVESTFSAVADEWLGKQDYAENSIDDVRRHLKELKEYLGAYQLDEIDAPKLLAVLRIPESEGKFEKAKKLRNKASQVFAYGVATGRCQRNPAMDLRNVIKTGEVRHRAAITDSRKLAFFMDDIQAYGGHAITKLAMQLVPHVFVRPGELRKAEWADFDLVKRQWTFTPSKTRRSTGVRLIVPLSRQVMVLLAQLHRISGRTPYLFPGQGPKNPWMSDGTILKAYRSVDWSADEVTTHGFRATARTFLEEELGFSSDLIEMQIAHKVFDSNGRAYNRTYKLKERAEMMQAWSDYLEALARKAKR